MPKRIVFLLLVMIAPLILKADDAVNTLFAKANQAYTKGNYADAAKAYQQIVDQGYQSAAVYFNLGDAYYKLNEIPSALLYFEKAHKMNPGDEDVNANIQLANSRTTDKIEAAPEFFLAKWWHSFILMVPLQSLAVISMLFWIIGFLILAAYLFASSVQLKKVLFYAALAFIFIGLSTLFIGARQEAYFAGHHQAIIFQSTVNVKSEPNKAGKNLFVIHEGAKVDVLETDSSWMKIKLTNGNEGWILTQEMKEI